MSRHFGRVFAIAAAGLIGVVLAGCGSDDNNNTTPVQNQIRTFNAFVPAAGASSTLNVASGSTSLTGATGVLHCGFSPAGTLPASGYQTYTFANNSITPIGTGTGVTGSLQLGGGGTAILAGNNTRYTLAAVGQSGQGGTLQQQLLLIPDYTPTTLTIPTGQSAVRLINLSPGLGQVSLFNSANGGTATAIGTGTSNIGYGFTSAVNQYALVNAGTNNTLSIRDITSPGTDLTLSGGNLANFDFQSGRAYTVYVCGQQANANQPLSAVIVQDFP